MTATLDISSTDSSTLTIKVGGRLNAATVAPVWRSSIQQMKEHSFSELIIDGSQIEYCDSIGAALLLELAQMARSRHAGAEMRGLNEETKNLLDLFEKESLAARPPAGQRTSLVTYVGRQSVGLVKDFSRLVSFVGELSVALVGSLLRPASIRWKDVLVVAEKAGADALPIVALVSFLMGLILAFQSAIPMRQFGAEIFVANLVSLSIARELGPLITAILLAGRTGSAFAAELGTMKVNEELDALNTMGLEPVRFLVVPRLVAAVTMMPLLTILAVFVGIAGGAVVFKALGFPLITYINQVQSALSPVDYLGGLFKAFVFGILVTAIGCLRGLQTSAGASAVGDSATRAVVSGIVLIVAADGIFSVLFYYLGI